MACKRHPLAEAGGDNCYGTQGYRQFLTGSDANKDNATREVKAWFGN
jgi:hypothetical protein